MKEKQEVCFGIMDKATGKRVINIVVDKNRMEQAHLFNTYISGTDEYKSSVYTLNQYKDNLSKVSSDNIFVFIGENDISDSKRQLMKTQRYNEYGINISWYGKDAVICAKESNLNTEEIKAFTKEYEENLQKIELEERGDLIKYASYLRLFRFSTIGLMLTCTKVIKRIKKIIIAKYNFAVIKFGNDFLDTFVKEATRN